MLPSEIKMLLDSVIAHLRSEHERGKNNDLREFKFKMANQGLLNSSVFDQGESQIYCRAFETFAKQLWSEAKRILEDICFVVYPNCEHDIVQLLNGALAGVYEADRKNLSVNKPSALSSQARLELYHRQAIEKTATEVKILCKKLQNTKREMAETTTQAKSLLDWTGSNRVTLAIVFTDIINSVAISQAIRDTQMNEVRRAHFSQSRKLIAEHNGREIKTVGDGFIAAFHSVDNAFDYAKALQISSGDPKIQIRVGIHIGAVEVEGNDVFGDAVDFTARLVGFTKEPRILLSERAKDDIDRLGSAHHRNLKWTRHDGESFKGFPGVFTVWSLEPD